MFNRSSLADYRDNGTAIKHFVNPEMKPTTDMINFRIIGGMDMIIAKTKNDFFEIRKLFRDGVA